MEEDQEGFNEWIEECSKHCTCDTSPCDGVMAGGLCDEINGNDDDIDCRDYCWDESQE